MKQKIITIGSALRDIILVTDAGKIIDNSQIDPTCEKILGFEFGAKNKVQKILNTMGGAACNVSAGLKKMGVNVFPHIEIGDDTIGQAIKEDLKKLKISTKLVQKDKFNQTGFSFVVVDSASREHILFSSKEASEDIEINIKKILSLKPDWLYVGSLGKDPEDEFDKIKSLKNKIKNLKIAINPGIYQIEKKNKKLQEILEISDVLILNRDEAISMVVYSNPNNKDGIPPRGLAQIRFLFKESEKWGPKIIVITDGEDGSYLKSDEGNFYCQSASVSKLIDTLGAGDAFVSGFLAGLLNRKPLDYCLKIGALNSASVVQRLGTQEGLMGWSTAIRKMKKIEVKKV